MDNQLRRRRSGMVVGALGALLLVLWLVARAGVIALPSESVRIFLAVVGAPLVLLGVLLARRSDAPPPPRPPA